VTAKRVTADPVIVVAGGTSTYHEIRVEGCSGRAFYANAVTELDGAWFEDAGSALAAAQFDKGSRGSTIRSVTIRQNAAVPRGAVGIYFGAAPRLVEDVHAESGGNDYTGANIFKFAGGSDGAA